MIEALLLSFLAASGYGHYKQYKNVKDLKQQGTAQHDSLRADYEGKIKDIYRKKKREVLEKEEKLKAEIETLKKEHSSRITDLKQQLRNRGEILTQYYLENLKKEFVRRRIIQADEMVIIPNVFIPAKDGRTVQLDHLVLLPTGIYIVETKHWSGHIALGITKKNAGMLSFIPELLGHSNKELHRIFKMVDGSLKIKNYGDPFGQVLFSARSLSEYLKANNLNAGWIQPVLFFNHQEHTLHDKSSNDKVKRLDNKTDFNTYFETEISQKKHPINADYMKYIRDHINNINYI